MKRKVSSFLLISLALIMGYCLIGCKNPAASSLYVPEAPAVLQIAIGFEDGELTVSGDDEMNIIYRTNSPSSIMFNSEGYTDVKWSIDKGTPIELNSLVLDAADYNITLHSISFTGTRNGTEYTKK